jgi:hypothetical protein
MPKQQHNHHSRETLSLIPPSPKTWRTPSYRLDHFAVHRHIKNVQVQLQRPQTSYVTTDQPQPKLSELFVEEPLRPAFLLLGNIKIHPTQPGFKSG